MQRTNCSSSISQKSTMIRPATRRIDSGGGILLNRDAMRFLDANYEQLHRSVIQEWIRFLERRNPDAASLLSSADGSAAEPQDQRRFCKLLEEFFDTYFYSYCFVFAAGHSFKTAVGVL